MSQNQSQPFNYQEYLTSREWGLLKEQIRQRCGDQCERCHRAPYQTTHHLTYERIGHELLTDLQGLCRECHAFLSGKTNVDRLNMLQGQGTIRAWQNIFLAKFARHTSENFLLCALPGSGKTRAGLEAFLRYALEHPQARLLIIVPKSNDCKQWQQAAHLLGIHVQTTEHEYFKSGMVGNVITYSKLCGNNQPSFWHDRCERFETFVICDEIHHASDESRWGVSLSTALAYAKRRLLLTGTPFRSDEQPIPFVSYDAERKCVSDHSYKYPDAVQDRCIRITVFQHDTGILKYTDRLGNTTDLKLSSDLPDDEASRILEPILKPGGLSHGLLQQAHRKLMELRKRWPDAAGLVLASNQDRAAGYVRQLHAITGADPSLIVSDDDLATDTLPDFKNSNKLWVVAVRQLSEGADIPRLMVLVYLTHYCTELFFRQANGRISRFRDKGDFEAYFFMPDHPSLVNHALNIIDEQDHAIALLEDEDPEFYEAVHGPQEPALWDDYDRAQSTTITEYGENRGIIIEGETFTPEESHQVRSIAEDMGVDERVVAGIVKRLQTPVEATPVQEKPLEDLDLEARKHLAQYVQRRIGVNRPRIEYATANKRINEAIGKPRERFTREDCERAIRFIQVHGIQ